LSGLLKGLEAAIVNSSELPPDLRCDAQFFRKKYLLEDQVLQKHHSIKIGQIAFVTDGPHGYHEVDEKSPTAMLTAKSTSNWFADRNGADTVADWVVKANKRSSLEIDNIILSTRGTVGNCALIVDEALPAIIDQDVAKIALNQPNNPYPKFILSYINSRFGQDHIYRNLSGMAQQGLPLNKVRDIPIPLLSTDFQKKISTIVDAALTKKREEKRLESQSNNVLLHALGLADWTPPEPLSYTARASDVFATGRIDAQYYMPAKEQVRQALAALPGQLLSSRVDSIHDQWIPESAPPTMRVRNYDVTDALVPLLDTEKEPTIAADIGSMKKVLKNGILQSHVYVPI